MDGYSPADESGGANSYQHIRTEAHGTVGLIRLDRPAKRNALCAALIKELRRALDGFEADSDVGAIVLTGGEKVFAVTSFADVHAHDFGGGDWRRLSTCRKPLIAAFAAKRRPEFRNR